MADVSEKLGVGLFLAVFAQGVFSQHLTALMVGLALAALLLASALIVISVVLSREGLLHGTGGARRNRGLAGRARLVVVLQPRDGDLCEAIALYEEYGQSDFFRNSGRLV